MTIKNVMTVLFVGGFPLIAFVWATGGKKIVAWFLEKFPNTKLAIWHQRQVRHADPKFREAMRESRRFHEEGARHEQETHAASPH